MPALGGAAFRPKKQFVPKKNDDDNHNDEIDFDHDDIADLPILDDATRKMIMRDIQRGKVPSFENNNNQQQQQNPVNNTTGAYGTGIQGASYLLQEKEKREQELQAMMRQVRLSGGQPPSSNKDILKRIQPEPTTKSTGTQPSARPSAISNEPQPQPPSQQPTRRLIVHRRQSEEHVPELNNEEETKNAQQQRQQEKTEKLDADLVDVMATRLRFLEKQNSFLQSEVKEKSIKLSNCQNKLSDTEEAVAKLQTERVILAEKIASMSRFLADYGLKWVGDEDKKENNNKDKKDKEKQQPAPVKKFDLYAGNVSLNNDNKTQNPEEEEEEKKQKHDQDVATGFDDANGTIEDEIEKVVVSQNKQSSKTYNQARTPPRAPAPTIEQDDPSMNNNESSSSSTVVASSSVRHFDFDKFVNMCAALSAKVSQHVFSSKNKQSNQIVSLRQREVVVVTVFADGITVAGGPFRPFGWALCDAFVQDVMDGYFPYEYRGRYPDGFPIDVVDKRGERYLVVPGGNNNHQLDPESLSSIANTPTKNNPNNNKKNKIRTLQDSPYSLRKHHNNNNNNPTNSKPSSSTTGHKLGGMRHAGVVSGAVATRDLILRRIPTRYVTASGRIINPAAGIAEFLNLPPEKLTSTMKFSSSVAKNDVNKNNINDKKDIIPQTPPRFSVMKNYKGPQIVVAAAQGNDNVEKNLNFDDEGAKSEDPHCQIRLRALFPSSGDQVDISINNHQNFTITQLQEAILSAASNQGILLRPPIDLNDHDHANNNNNNNNNYEMEFIVRRGNNNNNNENEGMTTTTTSAGPTTSFSAEDNDGMGSRQTSEFLTNNANSNTNTKKIRRETIVVRWRKIVKKN